MARSALLNVMVQAALKAGKSLSRDFGEVQNLQVSLKGPGDHGDPPFGGGVPFSRIGALSEGGQAGQSQRRSADQAAEVER